jgi:hypothetical protein
MCDSEFENIDYFKVVLRDETIFELDHPWKDWEIILMCKYIIQYSLVLCLNDGKVSFFILVQYSVTGGSH